MKKLGLDASTLTRNIHKLEKHALIIRQKDNKDKRVQLIFLTKNITENKITNEIFENTKIIGNVLYTDYFLLFQLSGIILLVAMIGAILLTLRKREGAKKQNIYKQILKK